MIPALARLRDLAVRTWPFILVTALGLWLLWPVPAGTMPLSADHTVHLTRAWLYGQQLAAGHLIGWSPHWFFGFPLGELYPPLGDLAVSAVHYGSLGLAPWPTSYALAFTLAFLLQGWALLRCGRALGWGPLPGLVAAALALLDVGAYREGGWMYTVLYGVWPQALATSLAWLALAELALAARAREARAAPPDMPAGACPIDPALKVMRPHRRLALAAVAAAGAVLAHPMALPMFAVAAPLWLLTVGLRGAGVAPPALRERLTTALLDVALVLALALGLAAWWLWPMSAHSGYMAAYGWLYAPLDAMLHMLRAGQWTQAMGAATGYVALAGLVVAATTRGGVLRFFALMAVVHWLLASTDVFWGLRLDRLSAGFSHIQYQRFLTAAKPGLYLLAGAVLGALWRLAVRTWSKRPVQRAMSVTAALAALGLGAWLLRDAWTLARKHGVGAVQVERVPDNPAFARHYQEFLAWAADAWQRRDADFRIAVRADRNAHWFMDAPVYSGAWLYKIGFTPGDNFVHKPESGAPRLLDRAQARYLLSHGPASGTPVATFGPLRVYERPTADGVAHLDGAGTLSIERTDPEHVRVRVGDVGEGSRLVFHIAGYPRWDLSFTPVGGAPEPVEWYEVPVTADAPTATPAARLRGELRGGKALGDDGSEPTLIAADARDGVYELTYARWRWFDVAAALASLAALFMTVLLYRSERPWSRLSPLARRATHPAVLGAAVVLVLALAGVRWRRAAAREAPRASAWLAEGRATATAARTGPLKTDMTIFPAILADPRRPSEVTFSNIHLGPALDGWIALDDDDAKMRRRGGYTLQIRARPVGSDSWTNLLNMPVTHRPDRQQLSTRAPVPADIQGPADLVVTLTPSGDAPPRVGFDLNLEAP